MTILINGWLNINKPKGLNSTKAVNILKRLIRELSGEKKFKIGHGGTLDPLASGVLPIAIGEATKTVDYIMHGRKTYNFTIIFGENRSTIDAEGKVIDTSDKIPNSEEINAVLKDFQGKIQQSPPAFSAIKINGKRAYDLARQDILKDEDIPTREVEIFNIRFLGFTNHQEAEFLVDCGKGFYIRSLARDICKKLGVFGYVNKLDRTMVGQFDKKDAISLEKLEKIGSLDELKKIIVSVPDSLLNLKIIKLDEESSKIIRNGGLVYLDTNNKENTKEFIRVFDSNDSMIAIGAIESGRLKSVRGFNL